MTDIKEQLLKQIDLPSAPVVIQQLTAMMTGDKYNSRSIARIVQTDQSLTARTLKLVNSPFYGFARQITSVDEAVTMLGSSTLQQLLLATSVVSSLGNDKSTLSMDDFWMHSFSVGVFAKHLLPLETTEIKNEAFMCGVLHDIGRLLFIQVDIDKYNKFHDKGHSVIDLEKEEQWFGVDHQQAGKILAEKWNFPISFVTCIGFHHTPERATEFKKLVAAIHVADIICHALELGNSGNKYVSLFSQSAWELLGLDTIKLKKIIMEALDEISETESMIRETKTL